ncbi:ankyrin repeat domain-containing protein [Wolbachia endosymbiont of Bemisia tabaci]|uniref:ankyrin repeat domain-containing protein n=1 Tax=Wolbachia endosymbiont of Bemisia tabaci TaxID=215173 RepID=UPI000D55320C|nr:ankyrin repeat domain-containing protein [Wolbachia endosymbiont of Bemisia tabaci]
MNAKTKSFNFKEKIGENSFFQYNVGIWTSLHFAIKNKRFDVTKVLLSMEASIKGDYINPLSLANKESFLEAVKLLMFMDKNVIRLGVGNYQKLFELAIEKNSPEVIKALVRKEINVNIEYQDGTTPLCRAVRRYDVSDSPNYELSLEVIRILLENGADTNFVDCDGCTSLDYTIMARNNAVDIPSWNG